MDSAPDAGQPAGSGWERAKLPLLLTAVAGMNWLLLRGDGLGFLRERAAGRGGLKMSSLLAYRFVIAAWAGAAVLHSAVAGDGILP